MHVPDYTTPLFKTSESFFSENIFEKSKEFDDLVDQWMQLLRSISRREDLASPKLRWMKYVNYQLKINQSTWNERSLLRELFIPALEQNIQNVLKKFTPPQNPVLELGSNTLNSEGHSYLSNVLPPEWTKNLVFSDFLKQVVKEQRHNTSLSYILTDAKKIDRTLPKNSLGAIISLSVLDFIERTKLTKVANSAFETLSNNGLFIIFTDRLPYLKSFLGKYTNDSTFALLWIDRTVIDNYGKQSYTLKGIKHISRSFFETQINQNFGLMPKYKELLTTFMALSKAQQQEFLMQSFYEKSTIFSLLELFMPEEQTTQVELETSYYQDLETAFKSAGFKISFNQKIIAKEYVPRFLPNPDHNVAQYELGRLNYLKIKENSPAYQEGMDTVVSIMHAFVAQKVE